MKKTRTLEDVCDQENFSIELLGNIVCRLRMGYQIDCKYQAKEKDQNGMYKCLNPLYNDIDYVRLPKQ